MALFSKSTGSVPGQKWYDLNDEPSLRDLYQRMTPEARSILNMQIWKDTRKIIPHRFIIMRASDGRHHRLDRVPKGRLDPTDILLNNAVESSDMYKPVVHLDKIKKYSSQEIVLDLNGRVDLWTIFALCTFISSDHIARSYSFLQHNCFFFSWTVLVLTSRYYLPHQVPIQGPVMVGFLSQRERLTDYVVEEALSVLVDIVIKTAATFRDKALAETPRHSGLTGKAGLFCPEPLLHTLWRQGFKLRLRNKFAKAAREGLERVASSVYEATLSRSISSEILDDHLWIDEGLRAEVEKALKPEVSAIIWGFILETLSLGPGSVEPSEIQDQLANPQLNYTWLGQSLAELFTVWGAALQGALWKARQALQDIEGLTHEATFEKAWINAREGALEAAKNAVTETREVLRDSRRDFEWERTWKAWDECWQKAHDIARPLSLEAIEKVVNKIVSVLTDAILADMKASRSDAIRTYKPRKRIPNLTKNVDLQDYMQRIIKDGTINLGALNTVQTSMGRIWREAHLHLKVTAFDWVKSDGAWDDSDPQKVTLWPSYTTVSSMESK